MDEHYRQSWFSNDFRDKWQMFQTDRNAIANAESHPNATQLDTGRAYHRYSSTCYSIAATAKAELSDMLKNPFKDELHLMAWNALFWATLGGFCYFRMEPNSDKAFELLGEHATPDEIDVRQRILLQKERVGEARAIITQGLLQESVSVHTKAFLLIGRSNCDFRAENYFAAAKGLDEVAELVVERTVKVPEQLVRVYKQMAELSHSLGQQHCFSGMAFSRDLAVQWINKAHDLAQENHVVDQIAKVNLVRERLLGI